MDRLNLAVRVYNKLKDEPSKDSVNNKNRKCSICYDRYMTIDTECRSSEAQALTILSYLIMNNNAIENIGLVFNPEEITDAEYKELLNYCKNNYIVKLMPLDTFIEEVFYPNVYTGQIPCIFFNAPFDLSRMACGFSYARGISDFTLQLSRNSQNPKIKIRRIDSTDSIIQFQGTRHGKFRGNFIDCQKLSVILTDRKRINLKKACKLFNKKYFKSEAEGHGIVNEKYIQYNINDTFCTAELFTNLLEEYNKYEIDLEITELYSSATLAKRFLENLGVISFMKQNPDFSSSMLGKLSSSYSGARTECRKKNTPTLITVLDFTSQYPSLNILLDLQKFLFADHIDYFDDTENTQKFIDEITLEDLRNPDTWKKLIVLVEIVPDDTLLSARAEYSKDTYTVGLNHITCTEPLYYGLPSVILSKLLTGKTPKIKSATRFVPVGIQKTLKKAKILGMEINPNTDNVFRLLIETRHNFKKIGDKREKPVKITGNSAAYGIGMELNREDEKSELLVYSRGEEFVDFKRYEKEGRFYNPIMATFITDAAKLLLGLGDCILQKYNEVIAYCDTDSMFVSPQYANEIVEFFDSLNPYSNVKHFLKVEEETCWFYGISSKRYVLYTINKDGDFEIKDEEDNENYSLHGLGHLVNPFGKNVTRWQKEIWLDILRLHYKKITEEEFLNRYKNFYAISQFTVSTPNLMRRFRLLNRGKKYNDMIKPYNFMLIGFGNKDGVKPIAPYSDDPQAMPYGNFINYKTGKIMKGEEYFKSLDDELWMYIQHPESKLEGKRGTLQRRHITVDKIIYIGKEADRLENNINGLSNIDYNIYTNLADIQKALSLPWKEVKTCGISKKQFYRLRKKLRNGEALHLSGKTLKKLRTFKV